MSQASLRIIHVLIGLLEFLMHGNLYDSVKHSQERENELHLGVSWGHGDLQPLLESAPHCQINATRAAAPGRHLEPNHCAGFPSSGSSSASTANPAS